MISRFISTGLKFNRTTVTQSVGIVSSINNKSSNNIYNFNNKRSFCTQNKSNEDLDVEKLFQITQEITKELGEEAPIADIEPKEEGTLWGQDFVEFEDAEDKMGFSPLPSDIPVLPTNNAPTSIEDLIITYQDPFKDTLVSNDKYFPYFRFTEPRGYTVESFLKKIGRGCDQHVELFEKWDDLMETTPRKLKDLQVPVRNRKWILHWVEEFKQGRDPVLISKSKSIAKVNKKK